MTEHDLKLHKAMKNLSEELVRLRRTNLRLKMHMDVLVSTPECRTAAVIRETYGDKVFNDSIIHPN
jgi:hypothetical protein